jgi:hypothetical protein
VAAFIVNGNIQVGPNVSQIAGMYVSSGTFNVARETGAPLQLTLNGMLLANTLNLNRIYGDITFPTYTINYQPQYAIRMLPYLGRTQVSWQELAP